jgi:hypothetical protein
LDSEEEEEENLDTEEEEEDLDTEEEEEDLDTEEEEEEEARGSRRGSSRHGSSGGNRGKEGGPRAPSRAPPSTATAPTLPVPGNAAKPKAPPPSSATATAAASNPSSSSLGGYFSSWWSKAPPPSSSSSTTTASSSSSSSSSTSNPLQPQSTPSTARSSGGGSSGEGAGDEEWGGEGSEGPSPTRRNSSSNSNNSSNSSSNSDINSSSSSTTTTTSGGKKSGKKGKGGGKKGKGGGGKKSTATKAAKRPRNRMDPALARLVRTYAIFLALCSAVCAGLLLTALITPWYQSSLIPLSESEAAVGGQCVEAYSLTSYGWLGGDCEALGLTGELPRFNAAINMGDLDPAAYVLDIAACGIGLGLAFAVGGAVALGGLTYRAVKAEEGEDLPQRAVVSGVAVGAYLWVVACGACLGVALGMGRFEDLVNTGLVSIDGFGVGRTAGAVGAVVGGVGVVVASALKGKLREAGVAKEALAAGDEEAKAQGRVSIHEPLVELQILGGRLRPKWVCC